MSSTAQPRLPPELIARIASFLTPTDRLACLLLSTTHYHAVLPVIYSTYTLSSPGPECIHASLPPALMFEALFGVISNLRALREDRQSYFDKRHRASRFWDGARHVKHLQLACLPGPPLVLLADDTDGVSTSHPPPPPPPLGSVLPHLHSISLLPSAVHALQTYTPPTYSRSSVSLPPFLRSLIPLCAPRSLCIAFRLLPSAQWEQHRDLTSPGSYMLVARLRALGGGWPSLERFEVHDVVHQVLPTLGRVDNVCHFAPHIVSLPSPSPSSLRAIQGQAHAFLTGTDAVGFPGPQWSERSWQISQSIKTLFPSSSSSSSASSSAAASLAGSTNTGSAAALRHTVSHTTWTFLHPPNGILTKRWRDDDDESGVGVGEVQGMLEQAVRDGLRLDLGAREGFELDGAVGSVSTGLKTEAGAGAGRGEGDEEGEDGAGDGPRGKPRVSEVLDRIKYLLSGPDGAGAGAGAECQCCGRIGMQGATVSSLADIDPDLDETNDQRGPGHLYNSDYKLQAAPRVAQFATEDMYSALMDSL